MKQRPNTRAGAWRLPARRAALAASLVAAGAMASAQDAEPTDLNAIARLKSEGLSRSQALDHVSWLSDVFGPRLTGSPAIDRAAQWAMQRLREWGLADVRQESFPFGDGWALVRFSGHMISPQVQPLIGFPKAWTPGTAGVIRAEVVRVDIRSDEDFPRYAGTLGGRIVLTQPARDVRMLDQARLVVRLSPQELAEAEAPKPLDPPRDTRWVAAFLARREAFLKREGVLAILDRGSDAFVVNVGTERYPFKAQRTDGGTIFVGDGGEPHDLERGLPEVTLAVEHYNRMLRILDKGIPVTVELDVQTRFFDDEAVDERGTLLQPASAAGKGFNILADIPGTDLAHEVVMLGAHFDSTHAGTGATDNAAGAAAMMEAMRILQAIGARPRRTIRLALWGGEEQGLLGSRAYVREHFANRAAAARGSVGGTEVLAAYFNLDNGTGRVRGIWAQENEAAIPIFKAWIAPLADLGVTTVGHRAVTGTDHLAFDEAGLPGFQFIQERLEYPSRTHHSNMDVVDRVQPEEVAQQAVVASVFAYHVAMRDDPLPRKATDQKW